jgi:hypothetical protein
MKKISFKKLFRRSARRSRLAKSSVLYERDSFTLCHHPVGVHQICPLLPCTCPHYLYTCCIIVSLLTQIVACFNNAHSDVGYVGRCSLNSFASLSGITEFIFRSPRGIFQFRITGQLSCGTPLEKEASTESQLRH